jgi:hypothetical protein
MQFLLAVRGCPTDNTIYTPVVPINVNCRTAASALGLPAGAGPGVSAGGAQGGAAPMMTGAQQEAFTQTRAAQAQGKNSGGPSPHNLFNGAGTVRGGGAAIAAAVAAVGSAALLVL